jgi:hypothetical protein
VAGGNEIAARDGTELGEGRCRARGTKPPVHCAEDVRGSRGIKSAWTG